MALLPQMNKNLLYHFLPDKYGRSNISQRHLKISFADQVNDLFEMKPFDFGKKEEGQRLRRRWLKSIKDHAKTSGFISFSADWSVPTMWAHYAHNHKGICLGFEVGEDSAEQIKYVCELKQLNAEKLKTDTNYRQRMFDYATRTKSAHWKYEREWRIFCKLDDTAQAKKIANPKDPFFSDFNERLVLKEIVFGHRSSLTTEDLKPLLRPADNVTFLTARPSFRRFKMVPQRMPELQN